MNHEAVCRTAPATPGLLNTYKLVAWINSLVADAAISTTWVSLTISVSKMASKIVQRFVILLGALRQNQIGNPVSNRASLC